MLDLDKLLKPVHVKKVKLGDKQWTFNYSTRTGLAIHNWFQKNSKDGNLDATKIQLNEFIELGSFLIIEPEFKDYLLELDILTTSQVVSILVNEWEKRYATDEKITEKKK